MTHTSWKDEDEDLFPESSSLGKELTRILAIGKPGNASENTKRNDF